MKVVIKETNKMFEADIVEYVEHNGFYEKTPGFLDDLDNGNFRDGKTLTDYGEIICSQQEWDDFCEWYAAEVDRYNETGKFGEYDDGEEPHAPTNTWEFWVEECPQKCKKFELQDEDGNIIETEYVYYTDEEVQNTGDIFGVAATYLVPAEDMDAYFDSDQPDNYKGTDGKYYNIREVAL